MHHKAQSYEATTNCQLQWGVMGFAALEPLTYEGSLWVSQMLVTPRMSDETGMQDTGVAISILSNNLFSEALWCC